MYHNSSDFAKELKSVKALYVYGLYLREAQRM